MTLRQADLSSPVTDRRGNGFAIDPGVFRDNVMAVRSRIPEGTQIWQVVKGDGYGLGVELAVELGRSAGVTAFCVGTPEEALRVRRSVSGSDVLLFTACPPTQTADMARHDVIVTVNSHATYRALVDLGTPARFFLELDCGFGRYGLGPTELRAIRANYDDDQLVRCVGLYTHFGMASDQLLDNGTAAFDDMVAAFGHGLTHALVTMIASSDTVLLEPDLDYSAVDPGRLLYGIAGSIQRDWGIRPVLRSVSSELVQVKEIQQETKVSIGYSGPVQLGPGSRLGTFPLGWLDGLSTAAPYGEVLVAGVRCPVLARTLQHSIVDVTTAPQAQMGAPVTLVGRDGGSVISLESAAAAQNVPPVDMHMRLPGAITKSSREINRLAP